MKACPSGKKAYRTVTQAEEALIGAWTTYEYAPGHGPMAVYRCEECGYYHLTSRGSMNERLAAHVQSGKLKLQQEADRWEKKIKGNRR